MCPLTSLFLLIAQVYYINGIVEEANSFQISMDLKVKFQLNMKRQIMCVELSKNLSGLFEDEN